MLNSKIGIMGGTFDPIHNGHLFIAEQVRVKYRLDKVIFIPSGNPPHKKDIDVADSTHRYNMVNLAIANNYYFFSSLIEINRDGETYTIDTLKELKSLYPVAELYFIIGYDAISTINTWKEYESLFNYTKFIVVSRSVPTIEKIDFCHENLNKSVDYFETPVIDISSTQIRKNIGINKSIKYMVETSVEKYIYKNNLYKARWTMDKILNDLKNTVSEKRYTHILGVVKAAKLLSSIIGEPSNKAETAALFHDYAKSMNKKEMLEYAKLNSINFDYIESRNKELMHGRIARHVANTKYSINDEDILNAIEFHTTGRDQMSNLEILLCLADYIEENRTYPGVEEIRGLINVDYHLALYRAFSNTIIHLISENEIVHTRSLEARNYLLDILNKKGICAWNISWKFL